MQRRLEAPRSAGEPASADEGNALVASGKKKGRLRCHKRPKSREETPKEGSDSGVGLGVATAYP